MQYYYNYETKLYLQTFYLILRKTIHTFRKMNVKNKTFTLLIHKYIRD